MVFRVWFCEQNEKDLNNIKALKALTLEVSNTKFTLGYRFCTSRIFNTPCALSITHGADKKINVINGLNDLLCCMRQWFGFEWNNVGKKLKTFYDYPGFVFYHAK